ncbi:CoA ester lyase [Pseudomonas sp. M30-35]|uniref:HpcH/HpaI aldolase/citrate lyase family protein n=1 Tax=Pseudomonas sp. M30-35 TaxID=1981174 RepID=UPI000B54F950|nr:CoA ester lyase [Pseudomonas sp. M30-35]ARU88942.1 CoA ester lyase [Pseudomonas sp. M30-35]
MKNDACLAQMEQPLTYLFIPGNRAERFAKGVEAKPDAIILDLEDAVHPQSKAAARTAVLAWHESTPSTFSERYIRINGMLSPYLREDMAWLRDMRHADRCTGIFLPKAEDPTLLRPVIERLLEWNPNLRIVAIIETARGVQNVQAIALLAGVSRLAFGSLDYSLDVNCAQSPQAFLLARSQIVLASRNAGLPAPIDGVTPEIHDDQVLMEDTRYARSLGFAAKLCIHPQQLNTVHACLLPDASQLNWADKVLQAAACENHAIKIDGKMVDLPLIEHAERIKAFSQAHDRRRQ